MTTTPEAKPPEISKTPPKPKEYKVKFTPEEIHEYQIKIFKQEILEKDVDITKWPQGTALVVYTIGEEELNDLVLSQKSVNIFDAYYDKLKTLGGTLLKINNWYGTINPKMWDQPKPKQKRRKKNG